MFIYNDNNTVEKVFRSAQAQAHRWAGGHALTNPNEHRRKKPNISEDVFLTLNQFPRLTRRRKMNFVSLRYSLESNVVAILS